MERSISGRWPAAQFVSAGGIVSHSVATVVLMEIWRCLSGQDALLTTREIPEPDARDQMIELVTECESVLGVELRTLWDEVPRSIDAVADAVVMQRATSWRAHNEDAVTRRAAPSELRVAEAERSKGASPRFTVGTSFAISGSLDVSRLSHALTEITLRHPLLRSWYSGAPGDLSRTTLATPSSGFALLSLRDSHYATDLSESIRRSRFTHTYRITDPTLWDFLLVQMDEREWHLTWTFHHIIVDQYSVSLLLDDLFQTYARLREDDRQPSRPEMAFVDFADSEWSAILDDRSEDLAEDWLAGSGKPEIGLIDRISDTSSRNPAPPECHDGIVRSLGAERTTAIRRFAGSHKVTIGATILTAWQLAMANFCGSTRVTTCVPVSRRLQANLVEGVGYADITLPVTSSWNASTPTATLLRETREKLDFASRYGAALVGGMSRIGRATRGTRLDGFDCLLAIGGAGAVPGNVEGLSFASLAKPALPLEFPAEVEVILSAEIQVVLRMDHNRFDERTRSALADYFVSVLTELPHSGDVRSLFAAASPASMARRSSAAPVHPLTAIERHVREGSGRRIAIAQGEVRLTYQELWDRAKLVRSRLLDDVRGAVAVAADRRIDVLVAVLGISLAGTPFAVLDPRNTVAVLKDQIVQGKIDAVVTDEANEIRLAPHVRTISTSSQPSPRSPHEAGRSVSLDDPAYVVFTSGTTGRPKAIMASWSTLATAVAHDVENNPVTGEVLSVSAIGFDVLLLELFSTLTQGATLRVLDAESALSALSVARALLQHPIEKVFIGPTLATAVAEELDHGRLSSALSLRYLLVSGDRLTVDGPLRTLLDANPGLVLENQYGPSETHHATSARFEPGAVVGRRPSIGQEIGGVSLLVLDGALNAVPRGGVGEAYVSGSGVAVGYVAQAALTAERFLPLGEGGERAYRTGDIVRVMWDGSYRFCGRVDAELKINGFRVDPNAVEDALHDIPGVREAAVTLESGRQGTTRLVAGVVTDELTRSGAALRRALSQRLPRFMVPSSVYFVDRHLPTTMNGKLDLASIAARPHEPGRPTRDLSPSELVLAIAILEVLDLDFVPVVESYFEVGGSSMQLPVVAQRARLVGGFDVPIWEIMEASDVQNAALPDLDNSWTPTRSVQPGDDAVAAIVPSEFGVHHAFEEIVTLLQYHVPALALPPVAAADRCSVDDAIDRWAHQLGDDMPDKILLLGAGLAAPMVHALATRLVETGKRVDIVYVPSRSYYVENDSSAITDLGPVLPAELTAYLDFGRAYEYAPVSCRLMCVVSRSVPAPDLPLFNAVSRRSVPSTLTPRQDPMDALTFPAVELLAEDVLTFLKEK